MAPTARPKPGTLGERIRTARLAAGMTLEGLAYAAGISFVTVHRIETGLSTPHKTTLRAVAQGLGTTVAALTEPGA